MASVRLLLVQLGGWRAQAVGWGFLVEVSQALPADQQTRLGAVTVAAVIDSNPRDGHATATRPLLQQLG